MSKMLIHRVIFLSVLTGIQALLVPQASALGFDPSGLRPPQCDQYQLKSPVNYTYGKATAADSGEYTFTTMLREGMNSKDCGGSDPDPTPSYSATIEGRWDGKTMHAYEVIHSQPPATGKITSLEYSCPENPWTASKNPDCKVLSSRSDNKHIINPAISGPYPVTAYRISYKGRELIAKSAFWVGSNDFILPPQLPPRINYASSGDIDGIFLKRNQDIPVTVQRPSDGSPEWYAQNLKSYDIELQGESQTIGSSKYSTAVGWVTNHVITQVPADAPSFVLPYTKLFNDPSENWVLHDYTPHGICRNFRIRVRIHDDVTQRPWSSWRTFMLEAPLLMKKIPGLVVPKIEAGVLPGSGKN